MNIPKRLNDIKQKVEEYVGNYGRRSYIYQTYTPLAAVDKEFARYLFKKYKDIYNQKVAERLEEILKDKPALSD